MTSQLATFHDMFNNTLFKFGLFGLFFVSCAIIILVFSGARSHTVGLEDENKWSFDQHRGPW